MNRLDRRTFLKRAGIVSVATAATTAVPTLAFASSAPSTGSDSTPVSWRKAPCRLCGVGCGLLIGVANGRPVAVRGDPDSPVSRGLACVKGYHAVEALSGRDRITRAMIRRQGSLVPVPLSEALDLVARTIQETTRRHGKDSVALYGSAQWTIPDAYIASKLFKGALGTNNVETSSRLYAGTAMSGLRRTFGEDGAVGCYDDIEHADTFVLWDVNLAETHPVLFSRMLERRKRNPAVRIIDLATRTSRTSYAADRALLFAAHAAPAVANAICHEIVAQRLADHGFIDRHVSFKRSTITRVPEAPEASSSEAVSDATWAEYVTFLSAYEPRRVEDPSGLAASSIRWLATLYGDPMRNVVTFWDRGVNHGARGTWMHNLLCNIHLLVGKVASPGNSPFCLTGQPGGGSALHDAGTLTDTLPRGHVANEADRRRAAGIWGVPVERLDPAPTYPLLSMFQALEQGDVRFLWVQATNPMLSLPHLGRYRRAAAQGDRFIVVSEAYPTPTTDIADVILPAAMWLEREGIYANVERRLQHFERMVPPPGEATSDAWMMIEVARRLGFQSLFPYEPATYVGRIWEEYRRFHAESPSPLPSLPELRARPGVQWPFVNAREVSWRYNTTYDPGAARALGEYDFYGHPDHKAWIWLLPDDPLAEAPDPAFPLRLSTGSVLEHWGGGAMTQRIPTLHRALPHTYLELNREDARELGVRNRERVRLVSRRGSLEIEARVDYRSQPPRGQVFVPSFDERTPINHLTLDEVDPLSGQPGGGCAVRVERLAGGA